MKKHENVQLITKRQVARILGMSERSVHRLTLRGVLPPPVHIGKSLRWNKAKILESISRLPQGLVKNKPEQHPVKILN
jgi:predicted DNA-binding transcriptional regulator AlpA